MDDVEYLRNRFREETEAARISTNNCVRLRHLEMATAYEFRIALIMRSPEVSASRLHSVEAGSL